MRRRGSVSGMVTGWGLALMAALAGCQAIGPAASPPALVSPGERVSVGAPATWKVENLDALEARQLLTSERPGVSRSQWVGGDRYHTGATSAYWGGGPLGWGYTDGGPMPFFSPSYFGAYGGGMFVADPAARTVYEVPALAGVPIADANVSVGGRFVSFVTTTGQLGIYDSQTQLIRTFPELNRYAYYGYGGYGVLQAAEFAPGFRSFGADAYGNLTYLDVDGRVRIFDPRTNQEWVSPTSTRGLAAVDSLAVSPSGQYIVTSGADASGANVYVTDVFSGRQLTVPFAGAGGPGGPITSAQLSAAGDQMVYSQGGQVRVLDLTSGFIENLPYLNGAGVPVFDASFLDPTGATIIYERDGQIQAYNRATHLVDTMPILNRAAEGFGDGLRYGTIF